MTPSYGAPPTCALKTCERPAVRVGWFNGHHSIWCDAHVDEAPLSAAEQARQNSTLPPYALFCAHDGRVSAILSIGEARYLASQDEAAGRGPVSVITLPDYVDWPRARAMAAECSEAARSVAWLANTHPDNPHITADIHARACAARAPAPFSNVPLIEAIGGGEFP